MVGQATTGQGVGRAEDGRVVLVVGAIVDERVRVSLNRQRGSYQGELIQLLEASPWRRPPPCPYADACGGCGKMHVVDAQQAVLQQQALGELMRRHDLGAVPEIVLHQVEPLRYRQRARLAVRVDRGRVVLGYRRKRGHDVIAFDDCLVLQAELVEAANLLRGALSGSAGSGEIALALGKDRRVVIELRFEGALAPQLFAFADEQVKQGNVAGIRVWQQGARKPAVFGDARPSFVANDGLPVHIAAGGFAQPSEAASRLLGGIVRRLAEPLRMTHLVELFAGSGTLTVALAPFADQLTAVEQDPAALNELRGNLALRGLSVSTHAVDANHYKIPRSCHTVLLDPPRAGAAGAMPHILAARPKQILYVACDPVTLVRDLSVLTAAGHRVTDIELAAIFPQTNHFETVVRLERR